MSKQKLIDTIRAVPIISCRTYEEYVEAVADRLLAEGELLLITDAKSNNSEVKSNKQIEEMAKDFCAIKELVICEECHLYKNRCHAKKYATRAYNAGYRKASEVAREIIDDIYKILDAEYRQYDTQTLSDTLNKMYMSSRNTVIKITAELTELKKKYTEEGK